MSKIRSELDHTNRRPIRSRGLKLFQVLAALLAKSSVTPNMISVSSSVFAALAGAAMLLTNWGERDWIIAILWTTAALMIQGRLIANLIDGMVAMEGGKATPEGELFNEVPDRISDVFILVGAGYSIVGLPVLGWAAAVVSVFIAYVRAIGASVGAGQVFAGPMAKPQRMAVMTLCCVVLAFMSGFGISHHWGAYVANGSLCIVVLFGLLTSFRRLRIISRFMAGQG